MMKNHTSHGFHMDHIPFRFHRSLATPSISQKPLAAGWDSPLSLDELLHVEDVLATHNILGWSWRWRDYRWTMMNG
jgi:hypothetical protein